MWGGQALSQVEFSSVFGRFPSVFGRFSSDFVRFLTISDRPGLAVTRQEPAPPSSTCGWARRGMACHSSHTTTGASSCKIPTQGHTQGEGEPCTQGLDGVEDQPVPKQQSFRTTPLALGQAQLQCGTGQDMEKVGGQLGVSRDQ